MTQSGYALKKTNRKFEDYASLKLNLKIYQYVDEYLRQFSQTTADAAADLEEVSGETIHDITDANKVIQVWQKTDQVGTDGSATGKVTWQSSTGAVTDATFTLDATNTTTHAALVSAVTTARHIRSASLDSLDCADEILFGNAAGDEIFGVIKAGYHQLLKSGFMGGYGRRSFLGKIKVNLSGTAAVVTIVVTYTPVGETVPTTYTITTNYAERIWEPCLEIAAGSYVTMTIEDDNAAHPVATVEITYVEAY